MIVEEAGGQFTDLAGAPRADGGNVATSNGLLHDEILAILRGWGGGDGAHVARDPMVVLLLEAAVGGLALLWVAPLWGVVRPGSSSSPAP